MKKKWITPGLLIGALCSVVSNGFATESDSGSFFNISAIGPNLQITKTLAEPYSSAGIAIPSTGFSLTSPGVECTLSANGQCLFPLNSTATKTVGISGPAGNFNVELCQSGTGKLHCQTPAVTGNRFLYVVNFDGGPAGQDAFLYSLDTSSQLISIQGIPMGNHAFQDPQGVALNPTGSVIYYTDNDAANNNNIIYCPINPSSGIEGNCQTITDPTIVTPVGIRLNPAGTYAYIALENTPAVPPTLGSVVKCTVNSSTGALTACARTALDGIFNQPLDIAFNPTGTYAYITNLNGGGIVKCTVNSSTGELGSCATTGTGVPPQPSGIAINSTGTYAFIGDQAPAAGNAYSCPINTTTGLIGRCTDYFIQGANTAIFGVALASTDNMLYLAGFNNQNFYECPVNTSTGVISTTCTTVLLGFNPFGIALR